MICKNCGATLPENETRCPKCGTENGAREIAIKPRGFSFKKNIIIIVIAGVLALGIGGTVIGVNVYNSPSNQVSRYLDTAERYLSEMNYEQAVIEFQNILEIEPMNVDAYLGLADAYIGMGDTEKALKILREGLEKTDDSRIQKKIDGLTKPAEPAVSSSSSSTESKPVVITPVYGDTECLQIEEMIEAYLRGEGTIDTSKLKNVTSLYIYGSDVAAVQCGNRYGTHFNRYMYSKNKVTLTTEDGEETEVLRGNIDNLREDIHFIFDIPRLDRLGIVCNKISDIAPLAGLKYLTSLELYGNQISDITPFAEFTNLTSLDLGGNKIIDITLLAGLKNLTQLRLSNNQISDITPLAMLKNLEDLSLRSNQISDITPLAGLTNLTGLLLDNNHISNITQLAGLKNLTQLWLLNNQISDITPLAGLKNLTELLLSGNQISDITPLAGLKNLEDLDLYDNQISEEDLEWIEEQLPNCAFEEDVTP